MTGGAPISRVRSHEVYANDYVKVADDEVRFLDGRLGTYLRITPRSEGDGVVILATFEGDVALVHTYRYPLQAWQWALPRGFGLVPDIFASARAELSEELGHDDATLTVVGRLTPDSGMLAARVSVVHAELRDRHLAPRDQAEVRAATWVSLDELWSRISSGEIEDAYTLGALALAQARGLLR